MCGIAGGVDTKSTHEVQRMCEAIRYRGPDHMVVRQFEGAVLGMVRLAIIDIAGGAQPISNETGDVWVVFNGEIYNFEELRDTLRDFGHLFRTRSDTETIVHAYEQYGDDFPSHLRGMFAIALWDQRRQRLVLVRDRLGEKPLYYHLGATGLTFASEIKSLLAADIPRRVNRNAAATFLALGYVPAPATAFADVHKLMPGEMAVFASGVLTRRRYWRMLPREQSSLSYPDAVNQLDHELQEAVRFCLKSDVEVAAFLSGGVDSSLISSLMQRAGAQVRTYSIGFEHAASGFSELGFAEAVSRHIGTKHQAFVVNESTAVDLIPKILGHYDEPNGEPTSMLVHLLCERVARDVKVAMGGTGGDELFNGYPRHGKIGMLRHAARVPRSIAQATRGLLESFGDATDGRRFMRRTKRFGRALGLTPQDGYRQWLHVIPDDARSDLVLGTDPSYVDDELLRTILADDRDLMTSVLEIDATGYLPEFQLTYMDRMSMANSLEVRSPLCDVRVVEFASSLPGEYRLQGSLTKRILKDVARRYLPTSIVDRRKVGFDAPVGLWFKTAALRGYLTTFLASDAVATTGLLDPVQVNRLVSDHLAGRRDYSMALWSVLSLEHWCRNHIEDGSRVPTGVVSAAH